MEKIVLAGAIIIKNEKMLLLHRASKDWYELPGGKLEQDEDVEDTVVRELKEELSVDIEIESKFGEMDFVQDEKHFLYKWYIAHIINNSKVVIPNEESETHDHFKWIKLTGLDKYSLSPNMKNLVQSGLLKYSNGKETHNKN